MGASDLEAVRARRAAIARELASVELAKVNLMTELEDLAVTERVLNRLQRLLPDDDFRSAAAGEAPAPQSAVGVIKSLLADAAGALRK